MVKSANNYLEIERLKPKIDVAPKHKRCREITAKIDKLVKQVEDEADDSLCAGYHRRIKQLQHEQDQLRKEIREAETQNQSPPNLLDVDHLRPYLSDIRGLLNSDVPNAAEAIRALTGPIDVRQEPYGNGKRGARWIASFSPNLIELLHQVTQDTDCPDSITLEFLSKRIWITTELVEVVIEKVPHYEELAQIFKQLHDEDASIHEIASKHGVSWHVALEYINFAETGERPRWDIQASPDRYAGWDHYQELAPQVAKLKDEEGLEWSDLINNLHDQTGVRISVATALRSYEYAHRRGIREKAGVGTQKKVRLGQGKWEHFVELFNQGITNGAELARQVGCSRNTANRWKKRFLR